MAEHQCTGGAVNRTLDRFRAHIVIDNLTYSNGNSYSTGYYSRYWGISVWQVRCDACGSLFPAVHVWQWSHAGWHPIIRDFDDLEQRELYDYVKSRVTEKYADRLNKYLVS